MRSATGSSERTAPRWRTSRRESALKAATPVDGPPLLRRVDLGGADRVRGAKVDEPHPTRHWAEERAAQVADVDAADRARLVEEVAAVPVPQLRRLALDDRAGPVVVLEVEAFRHRGGDARRLHRQELDDPEVGDVRLGLVELDAEG